MKKIILIVCMIIFLLIAGCNQQSNPSTNPPSSNQISGSVEVQLPSISEDNSGQADNQQNEPTGEIKEVTITAKKFEFAPATITVNKGDTVKFTLTSIDVKHGFNLPDFNVNEALEPNKPVTVQFVADKTGTFTFRCSVPCGAGHREMTGTLIVK